MKFLEGLKARFPTLLPVLGGLLVLGSIGGAAAYTYLGDDDCCQLGAPCCHPGAACCLKHHHRQ